MTTGTPFMVSVCLRGDDLNPVYVSEQLMVVSTTSQFKGEKKTTSTNHQVIKKIGMWSLAAASKSQVLADHVEELASKIRLTGGSIRHISGVQESYLDIYVDRNSARGHPALYEFTLSDRDIFAIAKIGLPVHFTFVTAEDSLER